MAKTRSRKTQEDRTWKAFATYIKVRDAIRTTGTMRDVVCFFCGQTLLRAESQASHIVSRTYSAALYNPAVVFAGCRRCNHHREGNHVFGFLHLIEMVGYDRAVALVNEAKGSVLMTMTELEDLEESCWEAVAVLEAYYETNAR